MLKKLKDKIKELMRNEIKSILQDFRNNTIEGKVPALDKSDGSPVTEADIKIGKLLGNKLREWLPDSVVINEEDFNEEIFEQVKKNKYVWIVDPIDGTRAFCDVNNKKYCVGVALLESMKPILSVLYIPEFEINGETNVIIEAIDGEEGIRVNEKRYRLEDNVKINEVKYVCHIKNDKNLNELEKRISDKCCETEIIKSKFGHSTLINYVLVAINGLKRSFSKRDMNIWDVVQSAYLVEKAGGIVVYQDGTNVFPLDIDKIKFGENKLELPFVIAGARCIKEELR